MTTREGACPYPGEQYILSVDRYQIEVMDHLDELPATGAVIFCTFPKVQKMTLDIPHAFLPSAPRHKFPCVCPSKYRLRCTLHAPAAYNPSGAPYAGVFL